MSTDEVNKMQKTPTLEMISWMQRSIRYLVSDSEHRSSNVSGSISSYCNDITTIHIHYSLEITPNPNNKWHISYVTCQISLSLPQAVDPLGKGSATHNLLDFNM